MSSRCAPLPIDLLHLLQRIMRERVTGQVELNFHEGVCLKGKLHENLTFASEKELTPTE